jgi:hypothetical protein
MRGFDSHPRLQNTVVSGQLSASGSRHIQSTNAEVAVTFVTAKGSLSQGKYK